MLESNASKILKKLKISRDQNARGNLENYKKLMITDFELLLKYPTEAGIMSFFPRIIEVNKSRLRDHNENCFVKYW